MGYPYAKKEILRTSDAELKKDMNLVYNRLKKHFNKKQLKDEIDFSNSIRIFLSIVKDVTYFLSLLDFLIRVETSPNQKRMSIYLIQQIEYVPL